MTSDTARPRDERRRDRYVLLWIAAGTLSVVLASVGGVHPDVPWSTVVGLLLGLMVLGSIHVQVPLRGADEATNLTEVALVPIMALLGPGPAVLVALVGGVVVETVVTRGQVRKLVFNVAFLVTGVALGSWVQDVIAGPGSPADLPGLLGAAAAGGTYVAVNLFAFSGVIAIGSGRRWSRVLREEMPSSLVLNLGTSFYGVLATVLIVLAPWALVFLLLPILLHRGRLAARSQGHEQLAIARDRFERTVAGTSDGVVLLDPHGRVEVFNPAMERLTGIDAGTALGSSLPELGLAGLDPGSPTDDSGEQRVTFGDRTLGIRPSELATARSPRGTVLAIRDITREAELAQIREDLVSRISHELRTPLTAVIGFLETLQSRVEDLTPAQQRDLVGVAHRSALRLSVQLSNLMVWSRIESRTGLDSAVPPEGTPVAEVLAGLLAEPSPPVPTASVHVDGDLRVPMSAEDLHTVLANLLTNAALYGAPPVEVHASVLGTRVALTVTDRGPGLPSDDQARVFGPFVQASEGLRRTAHGLGLGLAIVRALATSVGGDVRYETPAGGGARFVVDLPTLAEAASV